MQVWILQGLQQASHFPAELRRKAADMVCGKINVPRDFSKRNKARYQHTFCIWFNN